MRKLSAQDPNNPIWSDDLRMFEKARFREVQSAAAGAVQSRDLATLSQLLGEIKQQAWVEPPPKALVQGLRKADLQFRGQQTRAILTDLDSRLNDAFAARAEPWWSARLSRSIASFVPFSGLTSMRPAIRRRANSISASSLPPCAARR